MEYDENTRSWYLHVRSYREEWEWVAYPWSEQTWLDNGWVIWKWITDKMAFVKNYSTDKIPTYVVYFA